jgi:pimeloyl-ACP methyl ester carboxylesterase
MSELPVVLVHGGACSAACWDPLLPHLRPPVLAVDLPGRGAHPADLMTTSLDDFADSVVADIDAAGFGRVVIVGHSLAGASMPGVAQRLGWRVAAMVFLACTVPPDGETIVDQLPADIRDYARAAAEQQRAAGQPGAMDEDTAIAMFCNELDDEQRSVVLDQLVPEAVGVTVEPVGSNALDAVPRKVWIVCAKDAIVAPQQQRDTAARLAADIVELDASHFGMVHRPREVARVIEELRG